MVQFPCGICKKTVKNNHRSIECDMCQQWVHIKCNNLDAKTYEILKFDKNPWYCKVCLATIFPFSNQYKNLKTTNDSYKVIPPTMCNAYNSLQETLSENIIQHYYEINDLHNLITDNQNYSAYFHLNIGSISAHIDELQEFLHLSKINF